jgi:hypothetical protein
MTPQEQQMIDGLIDRIRNTQVTDKDLDAERYLQQGLAGNPDALYILAQTVLVQQYGLNQAQQQIQQLQAALDEAHQHIQQSGGGFLSKIFGGSANTQQTQYQPVNNPGYPPPYAPAYPPAYTQPAYPSGGGGFLRGALQTAAGVAMGEMAFQSMESLFHGFGGGSYGYGHPSESVVNNYYDDAGQRADHTGDASFYNPEHDASRQDLGDQSSSQSLADSTDNSGSDLGGFGGDTSNFVDNSGFDDSGFDDSGSNFDNGGGDNSF